MKLRDRFLEILGQDSKQQEGPQGEQGGESVPTPLSGIRPREGFEKLHAMLTGKKPDGAASDKPAAPGADGPA